MHFLYGLCMLFMHYVRLYVAFPSGTIMSVCVILNMFCLLILMPLLHDFCESRIHYGYAMTLCYEYAICVFFCVTFELFQALCDIPGSLVEHWSNGPFRKYGLIRHSENMA